MAKSRTESLGAFDDADAPPTPRALAAMLGPTSALWTRLVDDLRAAHGPLSEEWSFAGKAFGWSFRLRQKKRPAVFLLPARGHFLASLALGEKAFLAAKSAKLPAAIADLLEAAPKYAEGRGVRIPVRTARDAAAVETLVAIRLST